MAKQFKRKGNFFRPMVIFYILVTYVLASFIWWGYLLLDTKKQLYVAEKSKVEYISKLTNKPLKDADVVYLNELEAKYNRQKMMVFGEGAIFLLLIVLGILQLRKSYSREIFLNKQQRNFLLSITHELKSPLASIKLSLQTLLARNQIEDKFKKIANNSIDDVDRLEKLVNNILLATKIEGASQQFVMEQFSLSDLGNKIFESLNTTFAGKRDFSSNIQAGVQFNGDRMAISSVLLNLLENAVKYSQQDDDIVLLINIEDNQIKIVVADTGNGIEKADRKKVFTKFYRIGNEDTRKAKGTGLGLYIVEQVITYHGGNIVIKANEPQGSRFIITLPIESANQAETVVETEKTNLRAQFQNQ